MKTSAYTIKNYSAIWSKIFAHLKSNIEQKPNNFINNSKTDHKKDQIIIILEDNIFYMVDKPYLNQNRPTKNNKFVILILIYILSYSWNKQTNLFQMFNEHSLLANHIFK